KVQKGEPVVTAAIDEVVEVGTKESPVAPVVTTEEVTETEEVAYNTREVSSDQLAEGVRQVKTPGQKGVKTIVYTVTKTDGKETGRVKKSESITKDPVEEVVEVGTKVSTGNTNSSQVPSGQGQEGQTGQKRELPRTGEHTNILLSIMGLMLASLAGFINRKKRQD
ncbi:hypothetical protein HMPREF9380_2272, partial [Streptococcus sanguinis SK49]